MAYIGIVKLCFWIFLPILLLSSVIFRYNLLSCIYLLFLVALPYTPSLSLKTIGSWAAFTLTLIIISGIFFLSHLGFQIALLIHAPYGSLLGDYCSQGESIARYIGFVRLDDTDVGNVLRLVFPEIVIFFISILIYVLIGKVHSSLQSRGTRESMTLKRVGKQLSTIKLKNEAILCVTMLFLALAGIALPSIISSVYLLVFLILSVLWAFLKTLNTYSSAVFRIILSIITILQLVTLYLYQLQFLQNYIPPDNLYLRLFGLTAIIRTECHSTSKLLLQPNVPWTHFVSPACILFLHYMLAIGAQEFFQDYKIIQQHSHIDDYIARPSKFTGKNLEKKPLVQEEELPQSYRAVEDSENLHHQASGSEVDGVDNVTPSTSKTSGTDVDNDDFVNQADHKDNDGSTSAVPQPSAARYSTMYATDKPVLFHISQWFADVKRYSFYVIALVVMMLWSVTYHSWLTFILLLGACVLWFLKDTGKYTLYCSPLLVAYGILLFLLQLIYSLNLTEAELPTSVNQTDGEILHLSAFGIYRHTYPALHLGAQLLYLCGFLIVLHQFNYRRMQARRSRAVSIRTLSNWTESAAHTAKVFLCKYWIFVVVGFHLGIASEGYPTGIKIIYMFLFLVNIIVYSISWGAWRRTLNLYWSILVGYSMIVLILIYTYQFQSFPSYWKSFTNFTDNQLADLGLIQSPNPGELLIQILIPAIFLLVVILQLQYFNSEFLEYTKRPETAAAGIRNDVDPNNLDGPQHSADPGNIEMKELVAGTTHAKAKVRRKSVWETIYKSWWPKIVRLCLEFLSFIQRGLEFHVWKLVFISVFVAAVYKVSGLHAGFVLVWVLLLPFRSTHAVLFWISSIVASVIVICIMFYQLQFIVPDVQLNYYCAFSFYGGIFNESYPLPTWLGVEKMQKNEQFFYQVQGFIGIILLVAFEHTVTLRQQWRRVWKNEPEPLVTAFYPSITNEQVDDGIVECAKFFINYFFFKFGLEMCYVMMVVVVWARSDVFSIVYCLLLIVILTFKTRSPLQRFWNVFVSLLMVIILWQYAASLGMPPVWCQNHEYPWTIMGGNETIRNRLVRWLYLPDYVVVPYAYPSLADFFLLLFVVSQMFVFNKEQIISAFVGNNKYLTGAELDQTTTFTNPKKNFTLKEARSILDQTKQFVFTYIIWITMSIIFFSGTSRISIFTLGYLIIFFYLLSRHQALIMGKPSRLLKVFNGLIGYTVFVITLKASFQVASCVYIEYLQQDACFVVQLMSLSCAKPNLYNISFESGELFKCELPSANSNFVWDFVCFFFLLIQRRIFASYYFLHVAEDLRISMSLAARGAEFFNQRLIEEVREREKIQEETILSIKDSMQNIKQSYQNLSKSQESQLTHMDATRSGDYYMFADDLAPRRRTTDVQLIHDDIMDPVKMLHKADTEGIEQVLHERKLDRKKLGDDDLSVSSEILDLATSPDDVPATDTEQAEGGQSPNELALPKKQKSKRSAVFDEESIIATKRATSRSTSPSQSADQIDIDSDTTYDVVPLGDKIKSGAKFIWELFLSGIDTLTLFLNKLNRNYRNIGLRLAAEKERLSLEKSRIQSTVSVPDITIVIDDEHKGSELNEPQICLTDNEFVELKPIEFDKDQKRILRLFYAVWYVIISRTDIVCYFLIILNLMLNASMLALVLPLAVFLWGTFIIPRPAKIFWTFSIIYLEVVVVIKFIFQFEFFPWNSSSETNLNVNDPFWWPRFLGIEQYPTWSVMDLLQLLAIVFHSSILKVHGLWDNVDVKDDTEVATNPSAVDNEFNDDVPSTSRVVLDLPDQSKIFKKAKSEMSEQEKTSRWTSYLKFPYKLYRIYYKVLNQRFSSVTDVYLYMFLCDVINFLIIIFGYNAFGQFSLTNSTNVVSNLQSNNVPTAFLVMLLIQFLIMFIDRAIYLMKNIFAKFIFQIVMVIAIHIWMFFIVPYVNQRPFYKNHVAQTYYFFKAVYFLFAAYQIRAGYPKRVAGNFLTKSYGTVNLFLFKAYRAIPFLAEITAIMDWMYTGTSMSIGEWMKLWAIHAEVFEIKCWREFEDDYPIPRGFPKAKWIKYLVGGLLLFILLAIIWFPLLLMNIALTIGGIANNPTQVDLKITVGSFEPIFQVIADQNDITLWDDKKFNSFSLNQSENENAALFLQTFSASQVVDVKLEGQSKTVWIISPPQRDLLIKSLNSSQRISVLLEWSLTNDPAKTSVVTSTGSNQIFLAKNDTTRLELLQLLTQEQNASFVFIEKLFPQFIHSHGSSSTSTPAYSLYPKGKEDYSDVGLSIRSLPNQTTTTSWWSIRNRTNGDINELKMVVLSDKVSPSSLNFLVNYGIIGLYVSVVLVVGRLVRTIFIGTTASIMFVELPYVDRILSLCDDIFLVREEAEYVLEEDLYAKLIFLYRSPSTLIKWTRKPKED